MKFILDTHPFVFFLLEPKKLSRHVLSLFRDEGNTFVVPTISILEVKYLIEIGKIDADNDTVLSYIHTNNRIEIGEFGISECRESCALDSTRDPFDRIILSTARARKIPIITRDRWMKKNYRETVW